MGVLLVVGLSACATDYGIKAGGPHFASWEHLKYSVGGGEKPPLSVTGSKLAKEEGWWGIPVRYESNELAKD
jgi:hypothetical protein